MNVLRLAGCVIVDNQKRLLLLHRNKGELVQWELPGGKVNDGESDEATAVRELKEECGVSVTIERKLGSAEFIGGDTVCYYTWFLATLKSRDLPRICKPQTFDELRYVSVKECDILPLSANMANLLRAIQTGRVSL